ncbi:MAG: arsenical pump-driving ATPase [Phycisphaerales bacterium]
MTHPGFLDGKAPPVLIFGGKGGVGKTTCACATAVAHAIARPDERVLLVSTDPAHSVGDALAGWSVPNLEVCEIDARAEHERFMAEHADTLHQIASRGTFLEDSEIERFLDLSLPGVDELMCFIRISEWLEEDAADRIVIDTAPTGHALRLLTMPHLLDQWLEATDALMGKHRYMAQVFGGGSGGDPVEAFIETMTEGFSRVAQVWSDASLTRFIPVFNAEAMSIAETGRLLGQLDELEIDAPELVCNRLVPAHAVGSLALTRAMQDKALRTLPGGFDRRTPWGIMLGADEPRGERLQGFFSGAAPLESARTASADDPTGTPPAVSGTLDPKPLRTGGVLLLCGKGGVGKTTMACSMALASSAGRAGRTLIASTDPAGSLGDAFGVEIGDEPVDIASGLDAVQIDAEAQLDELKEEYRDELEGFLDSMSNGFDLAFDREALEHLLDLAPTGIDEVMALVRLTELLDERSYDTLIIDTAPTGHTLRLLELPQLIQQWLEAILNVLINYENVFSLPRINERLLRFSRGLKRLRAMLGDEARAAMVAVTIPTELACAETGRLIEGCESNGLRVAGVIINQCHLDGSDELGLAVRTREQESIRALRSIAGKRGLCAVSRGTPPSGVDALRALGERLLASSSAVRRSAA